MGDKPRFGRFKVRNFQVRSNIKWNIYPFFDILCRENLWFGSRFSLFWEFRMFKVWFQRMNLGSHSEGLRFGFLKIQEVQSLLFSGSFQVYLSSWLFWELIILCYFGRIKIYNLHYPRETRVSITIFYTEILMREVDLQSIWVKQVKKHFKYRIQVFYTNVRENNRFNLIFFYII